MQLLSYLKFKFHTARHPVPPTPKLTKSELIGLTPEQVFDLTYGLVFEVLDPYLLQAEKYALLLPPHWRAVYTVGVLNGEVSNGGHHQFFWNTMGQLNEATLEDLARIGAKEVLEIFHEAVNSYSSELYEKELEAADYSFKGVAVGMKERRMDDLDQAFFNCKKEPYIYLGEYVLNHVGLYVPDSAD
jgi:hypothetical protein